MRGLTPLQKFHGNAAVRRPRRLEAITGRDYARFLHEECFVPYTEACQRAGYSPEDDHRRQAVTFLVAIGSVALVVVALAFTGG